MPEEFTLYGKESFICAHCELARGRFLAFLAQDGDLWVGANWQLSLRPIRNQRVEWYVSDEQRFPMEFQDWDDVVAEVRGVLEKQQGEPADAGNPTSRSEPSSEGTAADGLSIPQERPMDIAVVFQKSQTYLDIKKRNPNSRIALMRDEQSADWVKVALVENHPTHVVTLERIRVWKDGRIEKLVYDDAGEERWIPDDQATDAHGSEQDEVGER